MREIPAEHESVGKSGRPSLKERQRQFRADAILDTAIEVLKTKGYQAMTLEDITAELGISRPTLYQHFKSKEDVVMNICLRGRCQLIEFFEAQDRARPAGARLIEFISWGVDFRFGTEGMMPFNDVMAVISAHGQDYPVADIDRRLEDNLVHLVAESQMEGTVRNDLSPLMLSQVLIGLFKNSSLDELVANGTVTLEDLKDAVQKLLGMP